MAWHGIPLALPTLPVGAQFLSLHMSYQMMHDSVTEWQSKHIVAHLLRMWLMTVSPAC